MTTPTTDPRAKRAHGTGSVYKRKGSAFYSLMWTDADGKRHSKPSHSARKDKAEEMLRAELAKVDRGEPGNADAVTYEDLERVYLDRRKVDGRRFDPTWQLKHLAERFATWKAKAITGAEVLAYEVQRLEAGASRATVNNELAALRRMFKLAAAMRMLPADLAPAISLPDPNNARQGFLEADDFAAVVEELPAHLRPVMQFGYFTGWRVQSEVITLQWRQVDLDAGTVTLPRGATKSGEPRVFPFGAHPALKSLLEAQKAHVERLERERSKVIPWVFPGKDGKQIHDYRTGWNNACRRAAGSGKGELRVVTRPALESPRPLVHDLRRTAVRNLIRAGVDRSVAKRLTGHETDEIFERYNITSGDDLAAAVVKLAAHAQGSGSSGATASERGSNPVAKDRTAQVGTGVHSGGGLTLGRERTA